MLDKYQNAIYHDNNYNCLHFAVDFYKDLTGQDMGLYVNELMRGRDKRTINIAKLKAFELLQTPVSPCLAIMHGGEVHAGIYHNGLITHFSQNGIQAQQPHIAELQNGRISYYTIKQ